MRKNHPNNKKIVQLVEEHERLAKFAVRRFWRRYPGYRERLEDMRSAALAGLWKAARTWDPKRGVPFPPYAVKVISWSISAELWGRHQGAAAARDARRYELSENTPRGERSTLGEVAVDAIGQREARDCSGDQLDSKLAELRELIDTLPPKTRQVMRLRFIEGLDRRAVAKKIRRSVPYVRRLIFKGVSALRAVLRERGVKCLPPGAPLPRDGNPAGCPRVSRRRT